MEDQEAEYTLETVDHLGLVSSLCREVGLVEKINRRQGVKSRGQV